MQSFDLLVKPWEITLRTLYGKKQISKKPVTSIILEHIPDVIQMRELYNKQRKQINLKLITHKQTVLSYMVGFHLQNAFRVFLTLDRAGLSLELLKKQLTKNPVIFDIGCGTGSITHGILAFLAPVFDHKIDVRFYDPVKLFFEGSKHLAAQITKGAITTHMKEAQDVVINDTDQLKIITLGYVINEMPEPKQEKILTTLKALKQKTLIIISEPATQQSSRRLQQIRNDLCASGYKMIYPCPHSLACPMLERSKDWCYSEFLSPKIDVLKSIDALAKIKRQTLHTATMIFASDDIYGLIGKKTQASVCVGRPLDTVTSKAKYLVCGSAGELTTKEIGSSTKKRFRGQGV